jgi:ketosteroid isomerase-like protein
VTGIVERYLDAVTGHDWDALRACLADDVVRVGPFNDDYRGRDAYVGFLSALMPTLPDYAMEIRRVTYADDGALAFAELAEMVAGTRTDESLVFELTGDRIARIDIFIKTQAPRGFP